MNSRRLALIASLSILPSALWSQQKPDRTDPESWDTFAERYFETAGDEESATGREQMEDLYEVYCHPVNLNEADSLQLAALPFLTPSQIHDVCNYIRRFRPLLSTAELTAVESLDNRTRRLLQLFTTAGPMPRPRRRSADLLRQAKHELTARTDLPLYTRMGYASYPAAVLQKNPNKVYQGSQPYVSTRYEVDLGHTQAGVTLEKDPGERTVDYWNAYVVVHDWGRIESLAAGAYRASFGLGLCINTGSGFGKMMTLQTVGTTDRGFRKHSSTSESGYLRGLAATVRIASSLRLSAFASGTAVDGTLRTDSTGISSLKTDGYHRTLLEMSKKGNLRKTDGGMSLQWQPNPRLRLSATAVGTHLSLPLRPVCNTPSSLYRRYNAQGTDFFNAGIAYSYMGRMWRLAGEAATDRQGHPAAVNMAQTAIGGHTLTLIQRFFPARFVSLNGHTYSTGSTPQNEYGLYAGLNSSLSHQSTLSAYVDLAYFPWLKYQTSQPSYALEALVQWTFTPHKGRTWNLRYSVKSRQKDVRADSLTHTALAFNTTHRLQARYSTPMGRSLSLQAQASLLLLSTPSAGTQTGWAAGGTVQWRSPSASLQPNRQWQLRLGLNYFHTDGYTTRIYTYEPGLLYTFGMSSFQNHGLRSFFTFSIPLGPAVTLLGKAASTCYFDRKTIGSGLDEIRQSHREDLQFQLRVRL